MWTLKHRRWLAARCFDDPALTSTLAYHRAAVETRETAINAVEADLAMWFDRDPFGWQVARLGAYRAFTHLGALAMAARRSDDPPPPTRTATRRRRSSVERPATTVSPLPASRRTQGQQEVVVTAIARELAGFVWAEMTAA